MPYFTQASAPGKKSGETDFMPVSRHPFRLKSIRSASFITSTYPGRHNSPPAHAAEIRSPLLWIGWREVAIF